MGSAGPILLLWKINIVKEKKIIYNRAMALKRSAKKSLRQGIKRRARNNKRKKKIKTLIKETRFLVSEKKKGEAKKLLPDVYKALDKAAKRGVIKKNTAARTKSRLTRLVEGDKD